MSNSLYLHGESLQKCMPLLKWVANAECLIQQTLFILSCVVAAGIVSRFIIVNMTIHVLYRYNCLKKT